jgi:hypothetical protein
MPEQRFDDALLVVARRGSRSALQSADIIIGVATSVTAATRWIGATFDAYPGCVVAGAWHEHGAWALLAARTGSRTLVRAGAAGLSWRSVTALAHLVHDEAVRP